MKALLIIFTFAVALFSIGTNAKESKKTKNLYGITGPDLKYQTSKSAQNDTYKVRGVRYTIKETNAAKSYSKVGVGSFYHPKFNGKKTSSGEVYDGKILTAAHKTLPLNSYALVTNMNNNKKVIVRINDRGPFVKGRIIDLSRRAASEIGLMSSGVGQVKVEAIHVDKQGNISGAGAIQLAKLSGGKNIQLDAGDKEAVANKENSPSPTLQASIGKNVSEESFSVRMTNFKNKQEAENVLQKLNMESVKSEITKEGNRFELHFGPVNSQQQLNDLKRNLVQLSNENTALYTTYNN